MNRQRLAIAAAVGLLASAAQAQIAQISQSGSNDSASIEQVTASGSNSAAFITQSGGNGNTAAVQQFPSAPGSTSASVTQTATFGSTGRVAQFGTSNGTTLDLNQFNGGGSVADLTQFGSDNTRIRAFQSATGSDMLVQQQQSSGGAYAGAEQGGNALRMTLIQGQPVGGVVNSSVRIFQYGDSNDATTIQANTTQSVAYTSQGSAQNPGSYYGGAVRGWVQVEPGIAPQVATNSQATVLQNDGFGHMAYILQYGSFQNAYVSQSGSGNLGGILQTGSGNYGSVTQTGYASSATISQQGSGLNANIMQSGSGNTATIRQR
jgi:hypothetical protein